MRREVSGVNRGNLLSIQRKINVDRWLKVCYTIFKMRKVINAVLRFCKSVSL